MEHKGTNYIETERLILRPFTLKDAPAMYRNWASDDAVTRFLTWPSHKDLSVTEQVLGDWISHYSEANYYQWAIVFKEYLNEPIGCIGVNNRISDRLKIAHIGYCIGQNWWHKGIVSEALERIIKYLFDEIGVNRIESRHDPKNPNSGAVMKKCGMKQEGILRQSDWNNQGICDAVYYAILADEWRQETGREGSA
ncbi:MAG: GNAT family N-acetyltransferase [Lachnospiraceae bacterium]|nr:GNAT family N-acetyltransferase [Lachnospiraceae bacterium]